MELPSRLRRRRSHLVPTVGSPCALTALLNSRELNALMASPSVLMELPLRKEVKVARAEKVKEMARVRSRLVPTVRSPCALTAKLKSRELNALTKPSPSVLMELPLRKSPEEVKVARVRSHLVPTVRSPCALTAQLKSEELVALMASPSVLMEQSLRKDPAEARVAKADSSAKP